MSTIDHTITLAAAHGLHLSARDATVNEAGLDYRVVMAHDETGRKWVLRVPRRADVAEGMTAEKRILDLVAPVLAEDGVAVPDWRVRSPELIAYPALPGAPGLTLTDAGEPVWHMDPASPDYAERLGRLLARLHSITPERAEAAGVEIRTPARVRQAWRDDIARVSEAFTVSPALAGAWRTWLDDDTCWPERTVMTHGEIYRS
ncbi:phosphotransferase [Nocardiopsis sp. HUAS JQ3]|uniref:phosphotransferase n=1 Tax=Nocardiopsis sp. HUAS JQ3 TaxID=3061629 RepID=UPI0023A98980|nr:phosphotransferase [Nocardiopsis sp. HUAS JQ3]WDZ93330.1 phosphotransferase [Nocardiopsis sp. HUAS JQ3]